jgi:SAM-dependent methyltransferase
MAAGGLFRKPNWKKLLQSWDAMQGYYLPRREMRFSAMLDVLQASLPSRFNAIDLGCGPGSLSLRILERFPDARVVAVDYDPVVMTIGKHALKRFGRRINWVDADISKSSFGSELQRLGRIDAALSTTALHWLYPGQLRLLYRNLGKKLGRGGIFENGDSMLWDSKNPVRRLSRRIRQFRTRDRQKGNLRWEAWWRKLEKDSYFDDLFKIRKARFPYIHSRAKTLPLSFHQRVLRQSGFRVVEVVWQDLDDRVLLAIK